MKIGKQEFDDYDFVKVCTMCYEFYLRHYKSSQKGEKSKEKRGMTFF
jgi:hypothetical protein